jgi:hypothetical protein
MELSCPGQVLLTRLFATLSQGPHELRRTRSFGGRADVEQPVRDRDHFVLTVAESEQRFWSPWLNVEVRPSGEGSSLVGRFSPHPSVWTGFAFAYLALVMVLLLSLSFSVAMHLSGSSPWTLVFSGGAVLVMAAMWGASQLGQRWAHAQMETLRGALETAVADCVAPREP